MVCTLLVAMLWLLQHAGCASVHASQRLCAEPDAFTQKTYCLHLMYYMRLLMQLSITLWHHLTLAISGCKHQACLGGECNMYVG